MVSYCTSTEGTFKTVFRTLYYWHFCSFSPDLSSVILILTFWYKKDYPRLPSLWYYLSVIDRYQGATLSLHQEDVIRLLHLFIVLFLCVCKINYSELSWCDCAIPDIVVCASIWVSNHVLCVSFTDHTLVSGCKDSVLQEVQYLLGISHRRLSLSSHLPGAVTSL